MTNTLQHPLRLNVGFLLHQSAGTSREFEFDLTSLQVSDDLNLTSLQGTLRFTRTAEGVYVSGRMTTELNSECVRCLDTYRQELTVELGDLFAYPPYRATDPILSVPETGVLNLEPLIREQIMVDLPLQPLCQPDCHGLCAICGQNLNEQECFHPEVDIDPRLSALKSLLPKT